MTSVENILNKALTLFKREGIEANSEENIIDKLGIDQATYDEMFSDKDDLVMKTVEYELKEQEAEHARMLAGAKNPVEEIMLLLKDGLENLQNSNQQYFIDLQQSFPHAWQVVLEHLNSYSYHQIFTILNNGVLQHMFRKDVNMQIVTKIILAQLTMILNPMTFPPERYSLGEVFRSVYLYYLRGLCTDKGGKLAEEFFSKHNL